MDPAARSTTALLERGQTNVASLLRRFENLVGLAPDSASRALTANESYQMEVETAALIRAAEDLTALTRALKELWLFGPLDTLGPLSDAEGRSAASARAVAEGLGGVLGRDERIGEREVRVRDQEMKGEGEA